MKPCLITAIGTPLDIEERLHEEGLARHLEDQWAHGIDGILVAGTMGLMQMLRDETYDRLVHRAAELSKGRGEIMIGAGDTGFARTRDRIRVLNELAIDGIVLIVPYFLQFSQKQLIQYFTALADVATRPIYLYDLPAVTNLPLAMDTYLQLAKHPNIRGAKVSGRLSFSRQLMDRIGSSFRVIVAEPDCVDMLLKHGVEQHLDGMFAIAPQWIRKITTAATREDWATAAAYQKRLTALRNLLDDEDGGMGVFTSLMNARGIPGHFCSAPFGVLSKAAEQSLLGQPVVRELLASPQ